MTLVLGIDPDTKCSGVAAIGGPPDCPILLGCWSVPNVARGQGHDAALAQSIAIKHFVHQVLSIEPERFDLVAVEAQEHYAHSGNKVRPNDLILLALISGAWLGAMDGPAKLFLPKVWKKQVPKTVCQARACAKLRMDCRQIGSQSSGYVMPSLPAVCNTNILKASDFKHAMDAVALALYAHQNFKQ